MREYTVCSIQYKAETFCNFRGVLLVSPPMPITSSAKKALRGSKRKQIFNVRRKRAIENVVNDIKKLLKEKKSKEAMALLPKAYQAYDKAVKEKTLYKNTASRKKSRLSKLIKNSK